MALHRKAQDGKFTQLVSDHEGANGQLCVAVFGAGGKSGLLQRLGNELTSRDRRVILSSLTHSETFEGWKTLPAADLTLQELRASLRPGVKLHVLQAKISPGKYSGVSPELLQKVREQVDICLFECDGARGRSLKVHNDKDPSVPDFVSRVVVVVGADIINTAVADGLVHRPGLFCQLWDLEDSSLLGAEFIARVITSQQGYGRKIPISVPCVYFVNKADTHPAEAEQLAKTIGRSTDFPTYMGSVKAGWCTRVA